MINSGETTTINEGVSLPCVAAAKVPRLGWWHAGVVVAFAVVFSFLAVNWVINWETTRGRVAPTERLVWNACSIHTGPLAGVFYWDYGRDQPQLFASMYELFTSRYLRNQLLLTAIVTPCFLLLVLPSTGIYIPPLRLRWPILIGCAFVLGFELWYISGLISIAVLS